MSTFLLFISTLSVAASATQTYAANAVGPYVGIRGSLERCVAMAPSGLKLSLLRSRQVRGSLMSATCAPYVIYKHPGLEETGNVVDDGNRDELKKPPKLAFFKKLKGKKKNKPKPFYFVFMLDEAVVVESPNKAALMRLLKGRKKCVKLRSKQEANEDDEGGHEDSTDDDSETAENSK